MSRRLHATIVSDDSGIWTVTSEFDSDAMASRGRLFHAKVAEDDADIEAVASELDSDAMD
jgi:hypothetical protein